MDSHYIVDDDDFYKQCGIMFLTLKGNIVFHCSLCENKYAGFTEYADHVKIHYIPPINEDADDFIKLEQSESENDETALFCMGLDPLNEEEGESSEHSEDFKEGWNNLEAGLKSGKNSTDKKPKKPYTSAVKTKNKSVRKYTCSKCGIAFSERYKLETHKKRQHGRRLTVQNKNEVLCELCGKTNCEHLVDDHSVSKPSEMKAEQTNRLKTQRMYKCTKCDYVCNNKSNLNGHMQRHSNIKRHHCSECTKSFHTRTELKTHFRSHSGERPFLCTDCGTTFTTAGKLTLHAKRHNNIRDKECSICDMKFYSTQLLRCHMTCHSEERPHKCNMCAAAFKRRRALMSHIKLHENKREYECTLCSARFNQRPGLHSHMKSKHSIIAALNTGVHE